MENVSGNYTGSVSVFNSEDPSFSSSIIDRIRQITQSSLAKMDELYDKFGYTVYVVFVGFVIATVLPEAYFATACILGVSSILGLGVGAYLSSRHVKYLCNKKLNKNKDL